eukprot:9859945-Ditylum_brightwellii.AAC.1
MDFTRKARFVARGHMTEPPSSLTYLLVVSRETVRIALTIAALNDLDIMAADIGNTYLNAPCREKVLHGRKTSGAAWRASLTQT